jgi:hypothetical protein
MSDEKVYYWDDEAKITGDTVTFAELTYDIAIADIIRASMSTSETTFMGMDRNTALPLLAGGAAILYILAKLAPEPGYYFVILVVYVAVTVLGIRAKRWVDDKRQMYTYTVVLHTTTGTLEAHSSNDKSAIRGKVSAINKAVKARSEHAAPAHSPEHEQHGESNQAHAEHHHHAALRPDVLPKLKKRH